MLFPVFVLLAFWFLGPVAIEFAGTTTGQIVILGSIAVSLLIESLDWIQSKVQRHH